MQMLTDLAAKYDIAVNLPHHVGNANHGRGASAMKDGRSPRSSPDPFDQRPPAERIVRYQQQNTKHCQVVWQLTIGTGIHTADERGDCVS